MPETLRGLYRQRPRWAKGGVQVLLKYAPRLPHRSQLMMWPICVLARQHGHDGRGLAVDRPRTPRQARDLDQPRPRYST